MPDNGRDPGKTSQRTHLSWEELERLSEQCNRLMALYERHAGLRLLQPYDGFRLEPGVSALADGLCLIFAGGELYGISTQWGIYRTIKRHEPYLNREAFERDVILRRRDLALLGWANGDLPDDMDWDPSDIEVAEVMSIEGSCVAGAQPMQDGASGPTAT